MVGWHRQLNGHEFEQSLGESEGQGSLVYCHPWGCKELDMSERLNKSNKATEFVKTCYKSDGKLTYSILQTMDLRFREFIKFVPGHTTSK